MISIWLTGLKTSVSLYPIQMKLLKLFLCTVIVVSVFSCKSGKGDIKGTVDKFADLECRAMTLREKRFELANKIRFTEDTLLHPTAKADTSKLKLKLQAFNKEKDVLLKQSLSLADTIRNQLNDLMKNQLADEKDKANFDQTLKTALEERGCIEKSR